MVGGGLYCMLPSIHNNGLRTPGLLGPLETCLFCGPNDNSQVPTPVILFFLTIAGSGKELAQDCHVKLLVKRSYQASELSVDKGAVSEDTISYLSGHRNKVIL